MLNSTVQIFRDALTESKVKCLFNKIAREKRVSNTCDVYDFNYDPRLEPKRPVKKQVGRSKNKRNMEDLDTSGEPDNSMKPIVKRLRKMDKRREKSNAIIRKGKKKQKEKKTFESAKRLDNNSCTENAVVDKINESLLKNISINNPGIPSVTEQAQKISELNKSTENPIPTHYQAVEKSAANELADITRSFLEDLSDEDGDFIVTTPTHVDIISKMIRRKSNNKKPQNNIFNSTLNSSQVVSSPWRINVSGIRKKPQFFSVKDKSFTPSYNLDIMGIRSATNLSSNGSSFDSSTQINPKLNCTKNSTKNKIQTSMLNFVSGSSKSQFQGTKSRGIFEDNTTIKKFPAQKVLGEINFNQTTSTPIRVNTMVNLNHSRIGSPKKKSSDDSLFGFSFISDAENEDQSENKENIPQRMSTRRRNAAKMDIPCRISLNEIKKVVLKEKPVMVNPEIAKDKVETVSEHIPSPVDLSVGLFDVPMEVVSNAKRFSRQYTRRNPIRKRLLSATSCHSDDESDETVQPVNKKKNMRSKTEEAEAERLAALYNSVFEDVGQHELCIE